MPEVTCSLIYVTTHSKRREDCCEWWTKMAANLNFLKLLKKIAFYPNRIFLLPKFIGWYIESDTKINILTIWALWRVAIETIWIREPWSPSECSGNQIALETTSLLLQACTVLRIYTCDSFIFRNKKEILEELTLSRCEPGRQSFISRRFIVVYCAV